MLVMKVCVLGSSSEGNATAVWTDETYILVDAGFSARQLEDRLVSIGLAPKNLKGIVVSHEHTDHTRGARVLSKRYGVPVYANRTTFALARDLEDIADKRTFRSHRQFSIGELDITPLVVPHDASEPNAFVITCDGRKITIATDLGTHTPAFLRHAKNSDLIVLESNYDHRMLVKGSYPPMLKERILSDFGHLSNSAAAKTLRQLIGSSTRHVLLAHLSQNNNTPDTAMSSAEKLLKDFSEVEVGLTFPHRCSRIISL
ncbi:MAG: MBL fold metallo-hydrolase [Thermoplasmata archaeon]|nr:MAG: MBL fold metallo-hydrolase [Thermoplasmata archaeon]